MSGDRFLKLLLNRCVKNFDIVICIVDKVSYFIVREIAILEACDVEID